MKKGKPLGHFLNEGLMVKAQATVGVAISGLVVLGSISSPG